LRPRTTADGSHSVSNTKGDLTFLPIMVVALDELALPHELDPDGLQGVEAAKLFASRCDGGNGGGGGGRRHDFS
jgi:hypothetical protein